MRPPFTRPVTLQPSLPRRSAAKAGPTQSNPVKPMGGRQANLQPATCNLQPPVTPFVIRHFALRALCASVATSARSNQVQLSQTMRWVGWRQPVATTFPPPPAAMDRGCGKAQPQHAARPYTLGSMKTPHHPIRHSSFCPRSIRVSPWLKPFSHCNPVAHGLDVKSSQFNSWAGKTSKQTDEWRMSSNLALILELLNL